MPADHDSQRVVHGPLGAPRNFQHGSHVVCLQTLDPKLLQPPSVIRSEHRRSCLAATGGKRVLEAALAGCGAQSRRHGGKLNETVGPGPVPVLVTEVVGKRRGRERHVRQYLG